MADHAHDSMDRSVELIKRDFARMIIGAIRLHEIFLPKDDA
jgi:hypothetical protein